MPRKVEEGKQLGQILLQPLHHRRVVGLPSSPEVAEGRLGPPPIIRPIDRLRVRLHRLVVALADVLENVSHLMHPAALMLRVRVNGLERRRQSRAAIGDDQQQVLAVQAARIQIVQKALPSGLTLALAAQKGQQLPTAVPPHPVGDQHLYAFSPAGSPHPQAHAVQKQVRPLILQPRRLKGLHQTVQVATQFRDRLRAHHFARQDRHHPPHLPGRDAAQKRFPDQQHHFVRPALKPLNGAR